MLAVALAVGAAPAFALSLGNAEVSSYLGQPLSMRVPVILDDLSDGSSQCPRIVAQPSYDVPTLAMGRMDIERGLTQIYLRLTTALPVDEPVLRVVLEIGCTQRVRREFTLLLDPPAGVANQVAAVPTPPRIEFGRPQIAGFRGQPLAMTVPIKGELAASLTPACVRTGQSDSTDLPRTLNDANVALVDQAGGRALRFATMDPVYESRVRVLVELGCDQPLRHEFVVLLDAPRLASTPAEAAAPLPAPAPAKRAEKPAVRVAPRSKPVLPAPAPTPPRAAAETPPASKAVAVPLAEPAKAAPHAAARTDRLVLAAPEDVPPAPAGGADVRPEPRVDMTPAERELVLKRLEVLAAEVKTLRAELDASAQRNRELSERARSASYAWAAAAGAALLLGIGILVGWRNRPQRDDRAIDPDKAGPMTRILGTPSEHVAPPPAPPAPVAPRAPAMTEGAGPNTVAAILAAHKAAHEQDTQGASTAIMVTEFHNTTQAIGELYSQYVDRNAAGSTDDLATQPAPARPERPGDLDLSNERTTVLAPNTKTEIAVDIDLDATNTQIGRDLQREYERLDLAGKKEEPEAKEDLVRDSELPTRIGPMTTKLALDLDLDLSTIAQKPTPGKGV